MTTFLFYMFGKIPNHSGPNVPRPLPSGQASRKKVWIHTESQATTSLSCKTFLLLGSMNFGACTSSPLIIRYARTTHWTWTLGLPIGILPIPKTLYIVDEDFQF